MINITVDNCARAIIITFLVAAVGNSASAQNLVLEEVIVTAQKRAQSLQDVPISVRVISGEKIKNAGIMNLEELSLFVPNVTISQNVNTSNLFIRGVGSGVNQAFEQSVGTFIDGVYMGRAYQSRAPFFDLAAVEVLKGPQSILFGKNTIAGAIVIRTAKPTNELEGYVSALYEPDHGEQVLSGVISGPLTENVSGRLAVQTSEFDGFIRNTATGEEGPDRETRIIRGSLHWDASEDFELDIKLEDSTFDTSALINQSYEMTEAHLARSQAIDSAEDGKLNYKRSVGGEGPVFGQTEYNDGNVQNFAMTANYQFSNLVLTSVTGYSAYDYEEFLDGDFTPLSTSAQYTDQDYEQWSQELRLSSELGGDFEYMVGVYFQDNDLESNSRIDIDASQALFGLPPGSDLEGLPLYGSEYNVFQQDTQTFGVFFHGTYSLSDTLRVSGGVRYTYEDKEASTHQTLTELGSNTEPATGPNAISEIFGWTNHQLNDDRTESEWTPSIVFEYDVNEDTMAYFNLSKGFKGGGFNESVRTATDPSQPFDFDSESVVSAELGMKATLLDGAANLNVAVFRSEFDDLQVSTFKGLSFDVGNAAEAVSQGIEVDGRWRVTDRFTLGGTLAYLDAEYDSWPQAPCSNSQLLGLQDGCIDTGPIPYQDLSGGDLQFAPDVSANLNAEYIFPLGEKMELVTQLDINYSDDILLMADNDSHPAATQDSFTKVDARIFLADIDGVWQLGLIGRNLTDEETKSWANKLPVSAGSHFAAIERPRSIAIQAIFNF